MASSQRQAFTAPPWGAHELLLDQLVGWLAKNGKLEWGRYALSLFRLCGVVLEGQSRWKACAAKTMADSKHLGLQERSPKRVRQVKIRRKRDWEKLLKRVPIRQYVCSCKWVANGSGIGNSGHAWVGLGSRTGRCRTLYRHSVMCFRDLESPSLSCGPCFPSFCIAN